MLTACSRKPICSAQPSPLPTLLTPTDPQTMSRTVPVRSARTQQQQPQPTQDGEYRIDFGSQRGRTLAEAPASWIRWVLLREVYLDRPALRLALEQAGTSSTLASLRIPGTRALSSIRGRTCALPDLGRVSRRTDLVGRTCLLLPPARPNHAPPPGLTRAHLELSIIDAHSKRAGPPAIFDSLTAWIDWLRQQLAHVASSGIRSTSPGDSDHCITKKR
jgi:hypothetical protein